MNPRTEIQRKILQLTKEGASASEISKQLGVSERHVSRIRTRFSANARPGRRSDHTEEQWRQARMFLEDGAGYRETAKSTGIPRQTLAYNLPGMGMSVEDTNLYRMAVMKYEIRKA